MVKKQNLKTLMQKIFIKVNVFIMPQIKRINMMFLMVNFIKKDKMMKNLHKK